MHSKPRIALEVPDPEDFMDMEGVPPTYIPVSSDVVSMGVELLQCFVSQYKIEDGQEPDHRVWDAMAISAAQMLSGLMRAWAAYYHGGGERLLLEQIAFYCRGRSFPGQLAELRKDPQLGYIADALVAINQEAERRRSRPKEQPEPAATERDPGWEF
jgi:hypothetical protein